MSSRSSFVLREYKMTHPLSKWLQVQGFDVFAEVPWAGGSQRQVGGRTIDLVGIRDGQIVAVEMKKSLCHKLKLQALPIRQSVNLVFCAVSCEPTKQSLQTFINAGIGILKVIGPDVIEVAYPSINYSPLQSHLLDIKKGVRNGVAGLPTGGIL